MSYTYFESVEDFKAYVTEVLKVNKMEDLFKFFGKDKNTHRNKDDNAKLYRF